MELSNISEFIKPELLVLVAVLYILGIILKNASFFPNNKIPVVLVGIGIFLAAKYADYPAGHRPCCFYCTRTRHFGSWYCGTYRPTN